MKTRHVSADQWRDAVKFLMGLGTNPSLSAADQRQLRELLRGPFASGMTDRLARAALENLGWRKEGPGAPEDGAPPRPEPAAWAPATPRELRSIAAEFERMAERADQLEERFDNRAFVCECCNAARYRNFNQYQMRARIRGLAERAREIAKTVLRRADDPAFLGPPEEPLSGVSHDPTARRPDDGKIDWGAGR